MTYSFNRYMVECEYEYLIAHANIIKVLIDTWWNVNKVHIFYTIQVYLVLIDTWWNVNRH